MIRSVWRITQNAEDSDDAFQEAMTQIWQRLPRIGAHPNPSALVLRICTNAACDVVRRKSRRDEREQSPEAARISAVSAPDVAALTLHDERRDQVQAAIAQLPDQQATAVAMRFLLYCPYEETSSSTRLRPIGPSTAPGAGSGAKANAGASIAGIGCFTKMKFPPKGSRRKPGG